VRTTNDQTIRENSGMKSLTSEGRGDGKKGLKKNMQVHKKLEKKKGEVAKFPHEEKPGIHLGDNRW